jgi:hypothetical protein
MAMLWYMSGEQLTGAAKKECGLLGRSHVASRAINAIHRRHPTVEIRSGCHDCSEPVLAFRSRGFADLDQALAKIFFDFFVAIDGHFWWDESGSRTTESCVQSKKPQSCDFPENAGGVCFGFFWTLAAHRDSQ